MSGDYQYRVKGHWDGRWQETGWMNDLSEAERLFGRIQEGNWMQLTIQRSDGAQWCPGCDEWSDVGESV